MSDRVHSPARVDSLVRSVALCAIVTVSAVACAPANPEKERSSPSETPPAASAEGGATAAVASGGGAPACLLEGDWTTCAVEDRLTRAGLVFERQPEPVSYPFFKVPGTAYHIGNAEHEVQVFVYPSAAEREQDTALLDSATVSPKGTRRAWGTPPTLVTSNNLAAIILSLNDRTVERLALALGAGLPQPEKR